MTPPPRYVKAKLRGPGRREDDPPEYVVVDADGNPPAELTRADVREGVHLWFKVVGFDRSAYIYEFDAAMEFTDVDFEALNEIRAAEESFATPDPTDSDDWWKQ